MQVKRVLNEGYGIQESFILDNHLCDYNVNIKPVSFLETIAVENYTIILSCLDVDLCREIEKDISLYAKEPDIVYFASVYDKLKQDNKVGDREQKIVWYERYFPSIGKYSSCDSICRNVLVESIGAFCSIAAGVKVVMNHPMEYITTHNLLFGTGHWALFHEAEVDKNQRYYFEGVVPRAALHKTKRIRIGNDVWLGCNVIITNGSNIGNGVIAGAGAVITKDVPDYAIVVGAPARIIRYRYSPEQIERLNKIAWWDWPDEVIRERYYDFYLPADEFLEKYSPEND